MSETHKFKDDSKSSIQAGKVMQLFGTPGSKTVFGRNSTQNSGIKTIGDEALMLDL